MNYSGPHAGVGQWVTLFYMYICKSHPHKTIENRTLPFAKKEPTIVRSLVWANVGDNRV